MTLENNVRYLRVIKILIFLSMIVYCPVYDYKQDSTKTANQQHQPQREFKIMSATIQNRTVRKKYADIRVREYLTTNEINELLKTAKKRGRYGQRDRTMILIAYRHGLRVTELVNLRWDNIDLEQGLIHVNRIKNGVASVHPVRGEEIRELRKLKRNSIPSAYLFTTERGGNMTTDGFRKLISRIGEQSAIDFPVHPHMLRHACGYTLANAGHDTRSIQHYLGHKNIQHTVRYTQLSANRFKNFWND